MGTVTGSKFDDWILDAGDGVTNGNDLIFGYEGDDNLNGLGGTDHLYGGPDNDDLDGGNDNDYLYGGGGGDDDLTGGSGADYLDGGSGINSARYFASSMAVFVTLETGHGYYGHAAGDTLVNVQDLWGSNHGDTLVGNSSSNDLWGHYGNDTLKGGGGADDLRGEEDNDILEGGAGADNLYGDDGIDTALYGGSTAGVTVSLMSGAGSGGDAQGDDLFDIENITGSGYADELWGDDGGNVLSGLVGNDTLKGWGGSDTLWGGWGHDHLYGGNGNNDMLHGEDGNDELVGGAGGGDIFVFDTDLDAMTNGDFLSDFSVWYDTIHLDDTIFGAFANGPLADDRFVVGPAALDGNDNIIYNNASGALLYDSDGNGAAAAVPFATVNPGVALTHLDFVIV